MKRRLLLFQMLILLFLLSACNNYGQVIHQNKVIMDNQIEQDIDQIEEIPIVMEEPDWSILQAESVMIKGDNIFGSGTILSITGTEVYIITNDHLSTYVLNPIVWFDENTGLEAEVISAAEQLDLGLIKVPTEEIPSDVLRNLKSLTFPDENMDFEVGMQLFVVGSATALNSTQFSSKVVLGEEYHLEFHANMITGKGKALAGMSGSGVFNKKGEYLGMISGAKDDLFVFLPYQIIQSEKILGGIINDED